MKYKVGEVYKLEHYQNIGSPHWDWMAEVVKVTTRTVHLRIMDLDGQPSGHDIEIYTTGELSDGSTTLQKLSKLERALR